MHKTQAAVKGGETFDRHHAYNVVMSLNDELQKLEQLYQNGRLSASEFAQAKTALLNPANPQQATMAQLSQEAKLQRLDRDWQMAQERYMVTVRYGNRYLPTVTRSWLQIVLIISFGVFWTVANLPILPAILNPFDQTADLVHKRS
jgi:hypothetical protein